MIRVERKGTSFHEMLEVADTFEGRQQFSVVRWPSALMWL